MKAVDIKIWSRAAHLRGFLPTTDGVERDMVNHGRKVCCDIIKYVVGADPELMNIINKGLLESEVGYKTDRTVLSLQIRNLWVFHHHLFDSRREGYPMAIVYSWKRKHKFLQEQYIIGA
jgi:hypothetical protein